MAASLVVRMITIDDLVLPEVPSRLWYERLYFTSDKLVSLIKAPHRTIDYDTAVVAAGSHRCPDQVGSPSVRLDLGAPQATER
jgi:hypothetical protein